MMVQYNLKTTPAIYAALRRAAAKQRGKTMNDAANDAVTAAVAGKFALVEVSDDIFRENSKKAVMTTIRVDSELYDAVKALQVRNEIKTLRRTFNAIFEGWRLST